jgi:hypothetical protein
MAMRSIAHWACVLLLHAQLGAQYWAPAELPITVETQMHQFYHDTVNDAYYFAGRANAWGDTHRYGLLRHSNNTWDTLGRFSDDVTCVIQHGDTLVVGGFFNHLDQQPSSSLVAYYNGVWYDYGLLTYGSPRKFKIINGDLYLVGDFDIIDGVAFQGIAKRENGQWVPVGNMPPPTSGGGNLHQVFDIIEYNGQLVVTGNINTAIGNDVFVLQGNDWVPLGGGLLGWNSFGKRLAVYQGDLYLGGGMSMNAGDVGQNIIRWDGQQWHPLGTGLQSQLGNFGPYGTVEDMVVHDGELFVGGGFKYAGGVQAEMVARWNGIEWCSIGPNGCNYVFCFGFFQDTLLINCTNSEFALSMGYVAKFIAPAYEDNCGLWASVQEQEVEPHLLRAWQQGDAIALAGLPAGTHRVLVTDAAGRVVGQLKATSDGQLGTLRSMPWAEGTYILVFPELGRQARLFITGA